MFNDKIESANDLFVQQLQTTLWVEQTLYQEVLPELKEMISDDTLKQAVEHHISETTRHAENIEAILGQLGIEPDAEGSEVLKGLRKEHMALMKAIDDEETSLLDYVHAGIIAKNEHIEIAAYEGLITTAQKLGFTEAVPLLEQNLADEKSALQKAEQASKTLASSIGTPATAGAAS